MARRTMSRRVVSARARNTRSKSRVVCIHTTLWLYEDGCQVARGAAWPGLAEVLAEPVEDLGVGLGGGGLVVAGAGVVEEGVVDTRVGDDRVGQTRPAQAGLAR